MNSDVWYHAVSRRVGLSLPPIKQGNRNTVTKQTIPQVKLLLIVCLVLKLLHRALIRAGRLFEKCHSKRTAYSNRVLNSTFTLFTFIQTIHTRAWNFIHLELHRKRSPAIILNYKPAELIWTTSKIQEISAEIVVKKGLPIKQWATETHLGSSSLCPIQRSFCWYLSEQVKRGFDLQIVLLSFFLQSLLSLLLHYKRNRIVLYLITTIL